MVPADRRLDVPYHPTFPAGRGARSVPVARTLHDHARADRPPRHPRRVDRASERDRSLIQCDLEQAGDGDGRMTSALRTPRAAAIAGVLFAILLTTALALVRIATPSDSSNPSAWLADQARKRMILLALHLIPFAGIAFLWFIGVVRDRLGQHEDRFFATVFLGSGLLFVTMLFVASAVTAALVTILAATGTAADVSSFGRGGGSVVLHTYAMRMAAVF